MPTVAPNDEHDLYDGAPGEHDFASRAGAEHRGYINVPVRVRGPRPGSLDHS